MTDELDQQIEKLEAEWLIYHNDKTRTIPIPDIMELVKLRIKRDQLRKFAKLS